MNKIYVVGVLSVIDHDKSAELRHKNIEQQRLWHFFANFEDAEKCVLENDGDIFEQYYNFALIEEHFVYDPANSEKLIDYPAAKQWWYAAEYVVDKNSAFGYSPVISNIEQPECFRDICNFWAN